MKHKKEITFYSIGIICSIILMVLITQGQNNESSLNNLTEAEALAPSEGSGSDVDKLQCFCSLWRSQNCATDNWGSECASGKNISCWYYNRNCS